MRTQSAAQAPSGRSVPSILDCKARAPPCQLAERPNNKRVASARVLRLLLFGRRVLRLVVVVQLCSQQTERAARYARLEAAAEGLRGARRA